MAVGGAGSAVVGAFAGGEGSATSSATVLLSEDFSALNTGCASSAGVKVINAALGQLNLG
jgi:hypothetical protein